MQLDLQLRGPRPNPNDLWIPVCMLRKQLYHLSSAESNQAGLASSASPPKRAMSLFIFRMMPSLNNFDLVVSTV